MRPSGIVLCLLGLAACHAGRSDVPAAGGPDFSGLAWVEGAPDLAGKVLLVRWWTSDCPLCSGSSPALGRLAAKVPLVAVYHSRPRRPVSVDEVAGLARNAGMPGILAVDPDGSVLDRWAPPETRESTLLTFLLDAHARIRYVHPGGLLEPEDEYHLAQRIEALLAEK